MFEHKTPKITKLIAFFIAITCLSSSLNAGFSSWSRYDPYPLYTTLEPQEFLNKRTQRMLFGDEVVSNKPERIRIAISPYGQKADTAKNINKEEIDLSAFNGRWSMIPLLFGELPQGKTLPPALAEARSVLFPGVPAGIPLNDANAIDPKKELGFFSIPLTYQKRGLRFEVGVEIIGDFGIMVQAGVSDISQNVVKFLDLTCSASSPVCSNNDSNTTFDPQNPALTPDNVQAYLTRKIKTIAQELCLDIDDFHVLTVDDVRLALYWRRAYDANKNRDGYPTFLITPYAQLNGIIATSNNAKPNVAFSVSGGSSDHDAVGFTGGININFKETIEVGAEAGFMHFFPRDICNFRVPNSTYQSGIFPFQTDVKYGPGHNWHFGAIMNAYHFMGNLSMYFQYVIIEHDNDDIEIKQPDPAFHPELLEEQYSTWQTQLANIGFNYDISPYISLGFLWQAPISQRNSARTSTVMFSLNAIY